MHTIQHTILYKFPDGPHSMLLSHPANLRDTLYPVIKLWILDILS